MAERSPLTAGVRALIVGSVVGVGFVDGVAASCAFSEAVVVVVEIGWGCEVFEGGVVIGSEGVVAYRDAPNPVVDLEVAPPLPRLPPCP